MVFGGQRRKIEELEHRLNSEVEFWKNELSKACNEKNYFAARALAAERSLADQIQYHCWEDPNKPVHRELCTPAFKTLVVDAENDVPLYNAKDQSSAREADVVSPLPLLPKQPQQQQQQQQQQRQGRYARPSSCVSSKQQQACPQVPAASKVATATDASTQVDPAPAPPTVGVSSIAQQTEPAPPSVVVSSIAQQTDADIQSDAKAAAMAVELEAQLMKARTDLRVAQDSIAGLEQKSHRLESALQTEQRASKSSAAKLATLKQEISVVKGLSDDTANQAASLLQALGKAQAHNTKLLAELATKEDLIALLTQQLGEMQGGTDAQPTTPTRTSHPQLSLPSSAPAKQHGHSPVQQDGHGHIHGHGHSPVLQPQHAAGVCPRQRLRYDEHDTNCSPQVSEETKAQCSKDDGGQTSRDGEQAAPQEVTGTDRHGDRAEGPGLAAASMQDFLPLPQPLASSSPCKQDGADSPASSSSTVTAQYGASALLFGCEESKGDGAESAPHQEQAGCDGQKKPQQLSVHCSNSSARSNSSSVAPSTPAASTPGRLVRTNANASMTPKARLEQQQQQQQQLLDKEALEASKRRLSRTPPMERVVSNGVNWGRGGSVEAFGEKGTTVMSIVKRFQ